MGTARNRDRESSGAIPGNYESGYYAGSGHNWVSTGYSAGSNLPFWKETCADVIAPYPFVEPHGLLLDKRKVVPLRFYGEVVLSTSNVRRHNGYNPANWTGHAYVPIPGPTDWNYWKAKALASINPFGAQIDVPLFLFELREFPRMLKGIGDVLSRRVGPSDVPGGYLSYNFGWAPLLDDLLALINLAKSLENTRQALQNASKGSRVSHKLGTKTGYGLQQVRTSSFGISGNWNLAYNTVTTIRSWCVAHVYLTSPLPPAVHDREMLVIQTALGLNLRPSLLWDAIPWSWLIDYFTNIGDIMEASDGKSKWKFRDLYVMVKTSAVTKITHELNSVGSMSFSGGEMSHVRKERSYMGSDPTVSLGFSPFLTPFQSSILGSLATATALRKSKR